MAGALPLAKRSAQSEWRVHWWWTWMYHAFTLLRKLDDDAGRLRSEMRARRMMRPGLSVSCRVLSYRIVPCVVGVCSCRCRRWRTLFCAGLLCDYYASIRFIHAGLTQLSHTANAARPGAAHHDMPQRKGLSCPAFGVESDGGRSSACACGVQTTTSRANNKTPYSGLEGRYYYCSV